MHEANVCVGAGWLLQVWRCLSPSPKALGYVVGLGTVFLPPETHPSLRIHIYAAAPALDVQPAACCGARRSARVRASPA